MVIEAKTKYTKRSFRKFQWFHYTKGGMRKVVFVSTLVLMFIVGVTSLIYLFTGDGISAGTIYLPVLILFLSVFFIIIPWISANSAYKKSPALFDVGIGFSFCEDYFSVLTTGMMSGTTDIQYGALYRVYQTKDYFYLYLQQNQSYLLDKSSFTSGCPEDLAVLLKKVLPRKKYRSYVR